MGKITNQMSNPHYDDSLTMYVDGSVAKPSLVTVLDFLGIESSTTYDSEEGVHEVGFYPLYYGEPFIGTSDREPNCELTYKNSEEFAFAVATKLLMKYRLATKTNHKEKDIKEKIWREEGKRYILPDRHLAMDVLLCDTYCRDDFEGYLSKNRDLVDHLIKASKISHFNIERGDYKEKINALLKRKEKIRIFNETRNTGEHEEVHQKLRTGPLFFKFRNESKTEHPLGKYAFNLVQYLRQFYGLDKEDYFNEIELASMIIEKNKEKLIPPLLECQILALEERKNLLQRGKYFPNKEIYDLVIQHCRKSFNKTFDAKMKKYKRKKQRKGIKTPILISKGEFLKLVYESIKEEAFNA